MLFQIGVGLIGSFAAAAYGAIRDMSEQEVLAFISGDALFPIALAAILAAGSVVFAMVRRSFPGKVSDGAFAPLGWTSTAPSTALIALISGALLACLYLRLAVLVAPPDPMQEFGPVATAAAVAVGWPKFVWAVLLLAAAPIEEFLFRGAMLAGFTRSFGSVAAGFIVTGLFILSHLPETNLYAPAIFSIAALGVGALVARQWTASLIAPICLHAAYNSVIVIGSSG